MCCDAHYLAPSQWWTNKRTLVKLLLRFLTPELCICILSQWQGTYVDLPSCIEALKAAVTFLLSTFSCSFELCVSWLIGWSDDLVTVSDIVCTLISDTYRLFITVVVLLSFHVMFAGIVLQNIDLGGVISLQDYSRETVLAFIRYLYVADVDIPQTAIFDLQRLASRYALPSCRCYVWNCIALLVAKVPGCLQSECFCTTWWINALCATFFDKLKLLVYLWPLYDLIP